ncbi:MAG TPA: hypothetical protein VMU18_03375 [Rhodoblastus sp.]|nr:hypothetical protein [Rhodoblastus sp.]
MKALSDPRRHTAHRIAAAALAVSMIVSAGAAQAQQNPLRAVTNFLGFTTDAADGPDFVRESRPDIDKLKYSNLTGVDKTRVPVKKPDELKAAQDKLVADRERADAMRKQLESVKVDPVAPNKTAPIRDE